MHFIAIKLPFFVVILFPGESSRQFTSLLSVTHRTPKACSKLFQTICFKPVQVYTFFSCLWPLSGPLGRWRLRESWELFSAKGGSWLWDYSLLFPRRRDKVLSFSLSPKSVWPEGLKVKGAARVCNSPQKNFFKYKNISKAMDKALQQYGKTYFEELEVHEGRMSDFSLPNFKVWAIFPFTTYTPLRNCDGDLVLLKVQSLKT